MSLRNRTSTRALWLAAGVAGAGISTSILLACATDGPAPAGEAPPQGATLPSADGGGDGNAIDVADVADAACDDCEYFPATCEADTLCTTGPFDPALPGGAFDVRTRINVIRGRSASDVWVAGTAGAIAHFDGTSWTLSASGTQETLSALWLADGMEMAFGRPELLVTRGIDVPDAGVSPGGWSSHAPASIASSYERPAKTFESAWAAPGAEWLWVASRPAKESDTVDGIWRMHRSAASGQFELDNGVNLPVAVTGVTGVHSSSADVLWAVGDNGLAVRVTGADGDQPACEMFNSQTWNGLRGVWAASDAEAWAVGGRGTIRRYVGSGSDWDVVSDVPTNHHLNAVWGTSSSDIWAVGEGAVVLHYDGARWSRVKIAGLGPRRPDLYTVWTAAPGHVWIGGHGVFFSLGGKP